MEQAVFLASASAGSSAGGPALVEAVRAAFAAEWFREAVAAR